MEPPRKVLVTGVNGLVGHRLVRTLGDSADWEVVATGRQPEPRFPHAWLRAGRLSYRAADLADGDALRRLLVTVKPDAIVNSAAMSTIGPSRDDPELCWRTNVGVVEDLADWCRGHGKRLVQLSTDFVFDGTKGLLAETDEPSPINVYGESKLAAERVVQSAGLEDWAIVRTVLVYGPGARIVDWVRRSTRLGKEILLYDEHWRTPTWVGDLAAAIETILRRGKTGLFHVSGEEYVSVHEFGRRIAIAFGYDPDLVRSEPTPEDDERPAKTGFVIDHAKAELDYRPLTIDEGLRRMREELEGASE